jgi:hypothetical protein
LCLDSHLAQWLAVLKVVKMRAQTLLAQSVSSLISSRRIGLSISGLELTLAIKTVFYSRSLSRIWLVPLVLPSFVSGVRSTEPAKTITSLRVKPRQCHPRKKSQLTSNLEAPVSTRMLTGLATTLVRTSGWHYLTWHLVIWVLPAR